MKSGGRYIRDKDGEAKLVERTQEHPKGNAPRSAPAPQKTPARKTEQPVADSQQEG